jgi:hypothetical protein
MRIAGPLAMAVLALGADSRGVRATDIPQAVVVLEETTPGHAGQVPEAAPPRFVLLEDGQVFVGGSSDVLTTKLDPRELKDLDKRLSELRKHPALAGTVALGPGDERRRLVLRKGGRPLDMIVTGDPARATPALRGLADFVTELGRYHHPGLRPYMPANLALSAREGALPGGCRRWAHAEPLKDAVFAPKVVAAAGLDSWPRGANPSSVCAGDKHYIVTLRPLLPGERP